MTTATQKHVGHDQVDFARETLAAAVTKILRLHLPAAVAATGLVSGLASAQDLVLEEVLVTAQKREESILDVPISISALGAEQLEALRTQSVEDYIFSIPNATFIKFGNLGPDAFGGRDVVVAASGVPAPDLGNAAAVQRGGML